MTLYILVLKYDHWLIETVKHRRKRITFVRILRETPKAYLFLFPHQKGLVWFVPKTWIVQLIPIDDILNKGLDYHQNSV